MTNFTLAEFLDLDLEFEPNSDKYSVENARFFAAAAASAYKIDAKKNQLWAKTIFKATSPKFTRIDAFPTNWRGTEGFVMECKEALVVSFCGTDSLRDWLQNMDCELVRERDYYVHEGFWDALNIVWVGKAKLLERVRTAAAKKPVWFCGHSLGGALATLAAFRCLRSGIQVKGIFSFGQPLLGEVKLAKDLSDLAAIMYRFANIADPVPTIPKTGYRQLPKNEWRTRRTGSGGKRRSTIKTKKTNYAHVGEPYWFNRRGNLFVGGEPSIMKPRSVTKMLKGLSKDELKKEQHGIDRYLEQLLDLE